MAYFLQNIVTALNDGSTYALIALGYTMVYGVLRLINFAHGDVFMLGAFVGAYSTSASEPVFARAGRWFGSFLPTHYPPINLLLKWITEFLMPAAGDSQNIAQAIVGILIAMLACGLIGYCIERFAYRPLRRSPKLSALITAIGVSLLIEYLAQIQWRVGGSLFFGPSPLHYPPIAGSGDDLELFTGRARVWQVLCYFFHDRVSAVQFMVRHFGVRVNAKDLIVIGTCLLTLAVLRFIVLHTRQGKAMRAASLNYDSAQLMGININRVISFTFVLGSMLAALGGCLYGLNYEQCWPLMGLQLGLKAFVAAVIGGIGNIPGAAIGGFTIALIETFVSTIHYHNGAILGPYRDAIAFVILIAVLLVRPEGIFGKAVAEKV